MSAGTSTTPYADFDPMEQFSGVAGDVRDPYPAFWDRRASTPVALRPAWGMAGESAQAYEVYRYDDVIAVLRDNVTFSSESIRAGMSVAMGPYPLVGMDEPEHKRLRSLVAEAFRQKTLAHWETDLVVGVVDAMIDGFATRGRAELVRELTFRYPVQVIAAILGLPGADHEQFHRWAMAIINLAARPMEGIEASRELRDYLAGVVEERRRAPGSDFLSDLVTVELDGERLGDEEIFSFLRLLLPAGAETTYRATGNFLYGLLTHTDQLARVVADRSLLPQAVEESIRWESPLLITSRITTRDTEVAGVPIPVGAQVIANIGSANHDETRWDRPDDYDAFREPKPIASFGAGVHMCLGMHLARMEMRVAVDRLLTRCPALRLDPEAVERDDPHIHGETFRSPTSLPVRFDVA